MEDIMIEDGEAKLILNGKFYDLRAVLKAGQKIKNDFFVLVDGDPNSTILVTLKPKRPVDVEKGAYEFANILLSELKELI